MSPLAVTLAAVSILLLLVCPAAVEAMCCVCEGGASNSCFGASSEPRTCAACAAACDELGSTMRTCCDAVADCSGGLADACGSFNDVCQQMATGSGFCDGLCTDPPTATPSETPTSTPTATATATDTETATATATATATSTATDTPMPQPDGADCADGAQCASTFCVDGVCCDQACDGPQEQCNRSGQRGTCTAIPAAAPALTPAAILLALTILAGLAAVAMRRRRGGA